MKKQLGFLVDTNRCIGCKACEIACKQEYGIIKGINWRKTYTVNREGHPEFPTYYFTLACNHCDNPKCLKGCPAGAYTKREKDGIVIHDPDKCLGCRYCTWNCYFNAPQFNETTRKVEKCNLCYDRIDAGLSPVCVEACPVQALRLINYGENGNPETIPGFEKLDFNPSVRFVFPAKKDDKILIQRFINEFKKNKK